MEQVWGIRLRCLTNCTCCETSELELFHIQIVSHTAVCEQQRRLYINYIIHIYGEIDNWAAQWQREEKEEKDGKTVRQTDSSSHHSSGSLNTCHHYRKSAAGEDLLPVETFTVSFKCSLQMDAGYPPVWGSTDNAMLQLFVF